MFFSKKLLYFRNLWGSVCPPYYKGRATVAVLALDGCK